MEGRSKGRAKRALEADGGYGMATCFAAARAGTYRLSAALRGVEKTKATCGSDESRDCAWACVVGASVVRSPRRFSHGARRWFKSPR